MQTEFEVVIVIIIIIAITSGVFLPTFTIYFECFGGLKGKLYIHRKMEVKRAIAPLKSVQKKLSLAQVCG